MSKFALIDKVLVSCKLFNFLGNPRPELNTHKTFISRHFGHMNGLCPLRFYITQIQRLQPPKINTTFFQFDLLNLKKCYKDVKLFK